MSECDSSDQAVSVVVVVVVGVNFFSFSTSSLKTAAWICFKFCVDVPWVAPYKVRKNRGATPIFHGIMGNFVQFLANS